MSEDDFQTLCLYRAESQVILQAIEAAEGTLDSTEISQFPCVASDRGVSDQTMETPLAKLDSLVDRERSSGKMPWWKFW